MEIITLIILIIILLIVIFYAYIVYALTSCSHKDKIIDEGVYGNTKRHWYDLQCEKCGRVKTYKS